MTVYQTDKKSGEYLYPVQADPDPKQPGEYIYPGGCVDIPPPTPNENQAPVWIDGWTFKEDFRRVEYFLPDDYDRETGRKMDELGPLPENASLTRPPVPADIQAERDAAAARKVWSVVADFYAEFTATEKYLLQTSVAPEIVVARSDLSMWRGQVWSDDQRIIDGLEAMVQNLIITSTRRGEILAK